VCIAALISALSQRGGEAVWMPNTVGPGEGAHVLRTNDVSRLTTTSACPWLVECLTNGECTACLSAVTPTLVSLQSVQGEAEAETRFFHLLASTSACTNMSHNNNNASWPAHATATTTALMFNNTLVELLSAADGPPPCSEAVDMYVNQCQVSWAVHTCSWHHANHSLTLDPSARCVGRAGCLTPTCFVLAE